MMSKVWGVLFALLATAGAVAADTLTVRSGDHRDFTRLVIKLPTGTDWALTNGPGSARLHVDLPDLSFDVAEVFRRIGRNRLADLRQSGVDGSLIMTFGCACSATAFVDPGDLLVVDIKATGDAPTQTTVRLPLTFHGDAFIPQSGLPLGERNQNVPLASGAPVPEVSVTPWGAGSGQVDGLRAQLNEERLLTQIRRAVAQDVLVMAPDATPQIPGSANPSAGGETGDPDVHEGPAQIAVTTVIDRDLSGVADRISQAQQRSRCVPDGSLDIENWATDQPFSDRIAELRSRLYTEFDRVDPDVARALALTYLHFGFGAEAKASLALFEDPETPYLKAMADILDNRSSENTGSLQGQQRCDGAAAMWSVLEASEVGLDVNAEAVGRSFQKLPTHLRADLGPRLSEKLAKAGHRDAASIIFRSLSRVADPDAAPVSMARAEVARSEGDPDTYVRQLEKVVATDSDPDQAPRALMSLVEKAWTDRAGLPAKTVALARAFALEHRSSDISAEIRQAYVLSLALSGEFDEAFKAFEASENLPQGIAFETENRLLVLLSEAADDIGFLQRALLYLDPRPGVLKDETADKMAARLLALGFAREAFDLLDAPFAERSHKNRRLIRAEAAIRSGTPHRALLDLLEIAGPQAAALRAEAFELTGNLDGAVAQSLEAQRPEEAARAAWLSGTPDNMPSEDAPQYKKAAELAVSLERPTAAVPIERLAEAQALLEDSAKTRDEINGLLELFQ